MYTGRAGVTCVGCLEGLPVVDVSILQVPALYVPCCAVVNCAALLCSAVQCGTVWRSSRSGGSCAAAAMSCCVVCWCVVCTQHMCALLCFCMHLHTHAYVLMVHLAVWVCGPRCSSCLHQVAYRSMITKTSGSTLSRHQIVHDDRNTGMTRHIIYRHLGFVCGLLHLHSTSQLCL